jgi:uncharacterized Zn-binding protein involved in type VI secretion
MHTCPMQTPAVPPIPHVGGPILPPGEPRALVGGLPAARVGDMCTCVGPPDSIAKGSPTVMIGGRPAARMGDNTAHGGVIVAGYPTVMIGESGSGSGGGGAGMGAVQPAAQRAALLEAAASGAPFCEECERARRSAESPPASGHAATQRAALKAAAQTGAPFCAECEAACRELAARPTPGNVNAASQRAALQSAAQEGTPFCEECERAAAQADQTTGA